MKIGNYLFFFSFFLTLFNRFYKFKSSLNFNFGNFPKDFNARIQIEMKENHGVSEQKIRLIRQIVRDIFG